MEAGDLRPGQVDQSAMLNHYALGLTGGAGGVDDIGKISGAGALVEIILGFAGKAFTVAVQTESDRCRFRHDVEQTLLREQDARPGILDHVGQTFPGVRWVQRQIGAACFEHGQQTNDHLRRPLQAKTDQDFGAHAEAA